MRMSCPHAAILALLALDCVVQPQPAGPPPPQPEPQAPEQVAREEDRQAGEQPPESFAEPPPADPAPAELELCEEQLCGPAPANPLRLCPDGVHQEGPGPCVKEEGRCHWYRLRCPSPGAQQPRFRTDDPKILLRSRLAADRIRAAKMIRDNREGLTLKARSDAYAPRLAESLSFGDEEVRVWVVMALATMDDRVMPILRRARQRETSARVNAEIDRILGVTTPAVVSNPKECMDTPANRKKMRSWPVSELCDPIGHYPPILFSLGDGTNIYRGRGSVACFRGKRAERCYKKCLPGDVRISTPTGTVAVRELRPGDLVWTFDQQGRRVIRPVVRAGATEVGVGHTIVEISLSDGRVVRGSAGHPTAGGLLGDLRVGSPLDGSTVREVRRRALSDDRTYDILPAGETGMYIADGVILGSTFRP